MKKYFISVALAVTVVLSFIACSDDDNKGSSNSNKPTDLIDLALNAGSAYFQYQQTGNTAQFLEDLYNTFGEQSTLVPENVDFGMPDANGNGEGLMELFGENVAPSGDGRHGTMEDALDVSSPIIPPTKARLSEVKNKVPFQYVTFAYKYDDKTKAYDVDGFGKFEIKASGLKLTMNGKDETIPGKIIKDAIPQGDNTSYNCREWAIDKISLEVKKNGSQTVGEVFNTTNLITIADQVQDKHDVKISSDDRDKLEALGNLEKIKFATNGRLTFYFYKDGKPGKVYTGTWSWSNIGKGEIKYKFDKENMKNPFIETSGTAKVNYKLDNKTITVIASYKNDSGDKYTINSEFFVKPYKK